MKILLAIQATGNGHISRAQAIYPILQKYGEVDVLLSGTQSSVAQSFPVKYHLKGLSFIIGKKGGVDLVRSFFHFDFTIIYFVFSFFRVGSGLHFYKKYLIYLNKLLNLPNVGGIFSV